MQSFCGLLRSQRKNALRWTQSACGAFPAHSSRLFGSDSSDQGLHIVEGDAVVSKTFDAAEEGAPVAVHQLIGDPRTGIADDTTTMPWGHDVNVEWIWSSQSNGVNWYRYSMSGPDQLPHMYMDSRLSDHSKNLMYMLRCKDPERWTIQALADKFRVRRQRVMAILTLKEMQAHRIEQGKDMQGPLQPYAFRVPLQDFHVQPDGEPVDLADLVALQSEHQQQQQRTGSAAAAGGSLGNDNTAAEGLGSLDEFLAPADSSSSAEAQQPTALSSLAAAAGGQASDLAALMPQIAVATQQLQLQLLQLLQQHHYSCEDLQRHLLHQVDVAEAYYNKHIAGTPLEQLLHPSKKAPKAKAAEGEAAEGEEAAASRPAWLDFSKQRQEVQQLISALGPVLQHAGPQQEREAGRMLAVLKQTLQEATAAAPAGEAAAEDAGQQAPAAAGLSELLKAAASEPATFAAAFNQLERSKRQQLLELAPDARVLLNIQGTDLRAALGSSSSGDGASADSSSSSSSSSSVFAPDAPGVWPGQVLPVVDVWGYEEVPRKQLAALQQQLPGLQRLLGQVDAACAGLGSSSSRCSVGDADLVAVQQAAQVYAGLVWEYDKVLAQQAALAADTTRPPQLGPQQQRRLMRILRELDIHAIDKLLLWESYFKEAGSDEAVNKLEDFAKQPTDRRRREDGWLRRLKRRVHAQLQQWDAEAAAKGQPRPFDDYPDLPATVPASQRVDTDMAAAHLDAEVVGRQFHRGSGDRHFVRLRSYPKFEGYALEEFDSIQEGELSALTRLAAEREDNMMWKEFRERLLRNAGLTAPDLHQHLTKARPPKPRKGWSFVVHPVGGTARALRRKQLRQLRRTQYFDDDDEQSQRQAYPGDVGPLPANWNAAEGPAPAEPYVVRGDGWVRGLTEEEQVVAGYSKAKPRRRWYASTRSRVL